MRTIRNLLIALVGLLALAGMAAAQDADTSCPECDEDGTPDDSSYSSVDYGVIDGDQHALVDTDASYGEKEDGTFFTWMQLCWSIFLEDVEDLLGVDVVDVDGFLEVYEGEDGTDVDGGVWVGGEQVADFDDSPLGDLDGILSEFFVEAPIEDVPETDGIDEDACVDAHDLGLEC